MKLMRLEVKNFGKLHDFRMNLSEGLNTLCEQNGFGKSTLAVFIKAVFYGLPATTKRNLDENERRKYLPWQGGEYGGWIEFECEKGAFRAERFFASKESSDVFSLTDLSTGKASSAYSEDLGLELFGIDAEGFERSTYLSQRLLDENWQNDSVSAKLSGLLENVDDIGNFDRALKILDDERKIYELKGGKGKIAEIEAELRDVDFSIDEATRKTAVRQEAETEIVNFRSEFRRNAERLSAIGQTVTDAKVRKVHMEEWHRREEELEKKQKRQDEIKASFGGALPTEEELRLAEEKLQEFESARSDLAKAVFPPEDLARLEKLREAYPAGTPDVEEISRMRLENDVLHDTGIQRDSFSEEVPDAFADRFRGIDPPSGEDLSEMQDLLCHADGLIRQAQTRSERKKPLSFASFLYPLIAGIVLLFAGLLISGGVKIPLLILGGGFCLISVGISVFLFFPSRAGSRLGNEARMLRDQADEEIGRVREFLSQYEMLPQDGDDHAALSTLKILSEHALENREVREKKAAKIAAFDEKIRAGREKINAFLLRYGVQALPEEFGIAIDRIAEDKQELYVLSQKQERFLKYREEYQKKIDDCIGILSPILNKHQPLLNENPKICLEEMKKLCDEHARLFSETRSEDESLSVYAKENRLRESVEEPSSDTLLDEEDALKLRQEVLQEKIDEQTRILNHLVEETDRLPELHDRKAELLSLREEAKNNLETLQKTMDFLGQAKDALSTRYLPGMRESLTHYLSLLGNRQISSATIDASFEVAVDDVGIRRDFKSYSQGWRDILQFCARLALVDTLFSEGETPFLLLDDPFVNLDNERLEDAKKLLTSLSEKFQILHFVCHTDRT